MERIKSVISHGHRKSVDAQDRHDSPTTAEPHRATGGLTGEGSHLAGSHSAKDTTTSAPGSEGYHPIYDQFTGHSTTGEPTKTTDQAPHLLNTTNVPQSVPSTTGTAASSMTSPSSTLRPDGIQGRPGNFDEGASSASIKSGVIGFPQGSGEEHAALGKNHPAERGLGGNQVVGGDESSRATTGDQHESSHLGRDAALGVGAAGTGGLAAHELSQKRHEHPPQTSEQQHYDRSLGPPTAAEDTNRSFPLAGGVTTHQPRDHTSSKEKTVTREREPGTKEKEAGVHDDHGREALAGAAAAAAGYSALPRRDRDDQAETRPTEQRTQKGYHPEALAAASASSGLPHRERQEPIESRPTEQRSGGGHPSGPLAGALVSSGLPRAEHEREIEPTETRSGGNHHPEALAAAGASTGLPHREREEQFESRPTEQRTGGGPSGPLAAALASSGLSPGHYDQDIGTKPTETRSGNHHPETLAAATAAASSARSVPPAGQEHQHQHGGHGHTFAGDPCGSESDPSTTGKPRSGLLFTSGPHSTDAANRLDPKLHIPGEFPSPTPQEEPSGSSYLESKGAGIPTATSGDQHELRHTGTLDQPHSRSMDQLEDPSAEHHYSRDAALAGGLGAAGVGAYEAGKHHQRETADVRNETFPTGSSPYSSKKLDPRIYGTPAGSEEPKFDPSASEKHHGRDAALTGGALGGAGLASQTPTTHRDVPEQTQPSSTQRETTPTASQAQHEKPEHHYGRDAGLAGAGAAAAGGAYYASQRDHKPDSGPAPSTLGPHKSNVANVLDPRVQPDPAVQKHHQAGPTVEDPASATVGPHKSNIANALDPRVLPEPEKQKGHTTTGPHQSDTLNRVDPKASQKAPEQGQHHYGRDAAVTGGAGAAGLGAYEAAKSYDNHRGTQPGASMNEQRYDPTAPGAHDPSTVRTHGTEDLSQKPQHHYGRDAAVAGGLGAAGAGTYAATRGNEPPQTVHTTQPYPTTQGSQYPTAQGTQYPTEARTHGAQDPSQKPQHHYGRDAAVAGGLGAAGAGAYAATRGNEPSQAALSSQQQYPSAQGAHQYPTAQGTQQQPHQRYDSTQDPNAQHQKRDAAALGAAGVAGAGGAYAYSQHDTEKERQAAQKAHEQQLKDQQKDFEKQQKEQQKQQAKEQAKEQKHHDKLVAAEEKKHHKEADKEAKQHDKEAKQHDKEAEKEAKQHGKEAEKEEEGKKKHHLFGFLHRDKKDKEDKSDENSPRQSRDSPRHSKEYAGVGAAAGVAGGATAYEATRGNESDTSEGRKTRNKLHKDPPKGHPAREVLEQQQQQQQYQHEGTSLGKQEHMGTDGPIGDPNMVSGDHQTHGDAYGAYPADEQKHTAMEPHTGLPMNTDLGDGRGGTDGSQAIGGYHQVPGQGQQGGQGVTDWEAIRKGDTLY